MNTPPNSVAPDDLLKDHIFVLNQLHDMKRKAAALAGGATFMKNIARIEEYLESSLSVPDGHGGTIGLVVENPLGEVHDGRRADIDADFASPMEPGMVITEVVRPVIKARAGGRLDTLQRGLVVVDRVSRTEERQ